MSSPPLDFPSDSDDVEMGDGTNTTTAQSMPEAPARAGSSFGSQVGTPARRTPRAHANQTPARSVAQRQKQTPLFMGGPTSSPLAFPDSSPAPGAAKARFATPTRGNVPDSDPLDYPSSPPPGSRGPTGDAATADADAPFDTGIPATPHPPPMRTVTKRGTPIPYIPNRRGDIHSSLTFTPTARRTKTRHTTARPRDDALDSDLPIPPSSSGLGPNPDEPHDPGLSLSAQPMPTDEPDEIRAIWGTTVSIRESMKIFADFLKGFKPKYRLAYDKAQDPPVESNLATLFPLAQSPNETIYVTYLRMMRKTSQTNLNVDIRNIRAWPHGGKKLAGEVDKYPQEVIPGFDQVVKDVMIEVAEDDADRAPPGEETEEAEREVQDVLGRVYKVRPWGARGVSMRGLNPSDTDKLISIRGLVIRTSPIIPDMKVAFFRCSTCLHTTNVTISRGKLVEPSQCPRASCASPIPMALIHNRCVFSDRQVIKIQETPEEIGEEGGEGEGKTPISVNVCVYDELVDSVRAGDRVQIVGVWRCVGRRVSARERRVRALFGTFVDGVWVGVEGGRGGEGENKGRKVAGAGAGKVGLDRTTRGRGDGDGVGVGDGVVLGDDQLVEDEQGDMEDEDDIYADAQARPKAKTSTKSKPPTHARLQALSQRADIYPLLARSIAPSIYALTDVKKGILLQLFGGTNKHILHSPAGAGAGTSGVGPRYRGDINVLLVGDPGVSKSQLLKYVHSIAPRGVYASGKGSSAVGLTAYVTRDVETRQLVLESGALVLSDGGVCCIDEFDKMSDATRSVLHEVMEQQTVSIAKAGIITTLNARASILAAANPIGSKYDPELPITRNIDLPPTLISRFDLLYLVLDQQDEENDRRLARFLCGLYLEDEEDPAGRRTPTGFEDEKEETLNQVELSAYITHARNNINPVITSAASDALVTSYLHLRSLGSDDPRASEKRITATTRQLESLIRLSEAHARMRWSDFVEASDVEEAMRLMQEAIRTSAVDPRTGKIDMGLLAGDGPSAGGEDGEGTRGKEALGRELLSLLERKGGKGGKGIKWVDALRMMGEQSSVKIGTAEFEGVVRGLEADGVVKVVGERDKRVIRRIVE